MRSHDHALPMPPAGRGTTLTFALWALLPAGLSLHYQARLLVGEQAMLGIFFAVLLPLWFACGLAFALVRETMTRPRRRVASLFLASTLVGVALLAGAARLSPLLLLGGPVARAFERLDPPSSGASVVPIDGDVSLGGHGRFVREDPNRSTASRAALPLDHGRDHGREDGRDDLRSEGGAMLSVERRPVQIPGDPKGGVREAVAFPVRDGWWYLFTDQ